MDKPLTLFIGSDHAGFHVKQELVVCLQKDAPDKDAVIVKDMGSHSTVSCDYPPIARAVCHALLEHEKLGGRGFGILICGSGIGMSITANRIPGIRAALCTHEIHAQTSRQHNNANVLCLGERVTAKGLALLIAELFMRTEFEGGRHQRRVELIEVLDRASQS